MHRHPGRHHLEDGPCPRGRGRDHGGRRHHLGLRSHRSLGGLGRRLLPCRVPRRGEVGIHPDSDQQGHDGDAEASEDHDGPADLLDRRLGRQRGLLSPLRAIDRRVRVVVRAGGGIEAAVAGGVTRPDRGIRSLPLRVAHHRRSLGGEGRRGLRGGGRRRGGGLVGVEAIERHHRRDVHRGIHRRSGGSHGSASDLGGGSRGRGRRRTASPVKDGGDFGRRHRRGGRVGGGRRCLGLRGRGLGEGVPTSLPGGRLGNRPGGGDLRLALGAQGVEACPLSSGQELEAHVHAQAAELGKRGLGVLGGSRVVEQVHHRLDLLQEVVQGGELLPNPLLEERPELTLLDESRHERAEVEPFRHRVLEPEEEESPEGGVDVLLPRLSGLLVAFEFELVVDRGQPRGEFTVTRVGDLTHQIVGLLLAEDRDQDVLRRCGVHQGPRVGVGVVLRTHRHRIHRVCTFCRCAP